MTRQEQPPVRVEDLARHLDIVTKHDPEAGVIGYHGMQEDGTWDVGYGDETATSRDATVAHQLKRIIDAPFGDSLYPPCDVMAAMRLKHYVPEYFAARLPLPPRW